METTTDNKININERNSSYLNHISHIKNITKPQQTQYLSYSHTYAWSFNKAKKCKLILLSNIILIK